MLWMWQAGAPCEADVTAVAVVPSAAPTPAPVVPTSVAATEMTSYNATMATTPYTTRPASGATWERQPAATSAVG